jgi:hypothetical protein
MNFRKLKAAQAMNRFTESPIRPEVVSKHPVIVLEMADN